MNKAEQLMNQIRDLTNQLQKLQEECPHEDVEYHRYNIPKGQWHMENGGQRVVKADGWDSKAVARCLVCQKTWIADPPEEPSEATLEALESGLEDFKEGRTRTVTLDDLVDTEGSDD